MGHNERIWMDLSCYLPAASLRFSYDSLFLHSVVITSFVSCWIYFTKYYFIAKLNFLSKVRNYFVFEEIVFILIVTFKANIM